MIPLDLPASRPHSAKALDRNWPANIASPPRKKMGEGGGMGIMN
jgi:hypothetical protein